MTSLIKRFERNKRGRDLIVGDVHGCFTKLQKALDAIGFDKSCDRLFAVGDLIDRGSESRDVLDWLGKEWFHSVMGNHEQMAVMYHVGECDPGMYAMNGGMWFIAMTPDERFDFASAFFDLPIAIELETEDGIVGIIHAACDYPLWSDFREAIDGDGRDAAIGNAVWGRDRANGSPLGPVNGVRAVVVGHTPMERMTSMDNVLFIDTGAWLQNGSTARPFTIIDAATLMPPEPAKEAA
jgi:serine/threonine protein phosphatase 1